MRRRLPSQMPRRDRGRRSWFVGPRALQGGPENQESLCEGEPHGWPMSPCTSVPEQTLPFSSEGIRLRIMSSRTTIPPRPAPSAGPPRRHSRAGQRRARTPHPPGGEGREADGPGRARVAWNPPSRRGTREVFEAMTLKTHTPCESARNDRPGEPGEAVHSGALRSEAGRHPARISPRGDARSRTATGTPAPSLLAGGGGSSAAGRGPRPTPSSPPRGGRPRRLLPPSPRAARTFGRSGVHATA